jgi:hypothetical protein
MPEDRDPAERGWLGLLYRNWRPTWLGRLVTRYWAWRAARGLAPAQVVSLQTIDGVTGALTERPVVPCEYEGARYLVSMLGDGSGWVRDTASDGSAVIRDGQDRAVKLSEVPVQERAPILKAWCQIATSGRKHVPVDADAPVEAFAAIAADYPVFLIEDRSAAT